MDQVFSHLVFIKGCFFTLFQVITSREKKATIYTKTALLNNVIVLLRLHPWARIQLVTQ